MVATTNYVKYPTRIILLCTKNYVKHATQIIPLCTNYSKLLYHVRKIFTSRDIVY